MVFEICDATRDDDGEDIADELLIEEDSIPKYLWKYWRKRNQIFSKFNEGVWINEQGWYSVTPEDVAINIATHVTKHTPASPLTILDGFAGTGANAIHFARQASVRRVIAIEKDATTLRCAMHNAKLYGVAEKIEFVLGDYFDFVEHFAGKSERWRVENRVDVVFLSPPWGGPGYRYDEVLDLEKMQPYSVSEILNAAYKLTTNIALYIPRTSDIIQLRNIVEYQYTQSSFHSRSSSDDDDDDDDDDSSSKGFSEQEKILLSYLHEDGHCVAICAYLGALAVPAMKDYGVVLIED
ncbi:RNA cap guanine-N2 methyltransferase-domain-containing protein [Myxozyma melibiosi]|uniref:Trimethylguanosine synthase n=1 Tax=Myxozyma melibiosi TaxID=54550 RepID=A0ABR1F259_9ASCO